MTYNNALQEQLSKYLGEEKIPAKYTKLFESISNSYDLNEKVNGFLEHHVKLRADEILEQNKVLKMESIKLKAAQQHIKILFENIDEFIFCIDVKNNKVLHMSNACFKSSGYTPEEFATNMNLWFEIIHPDDKTKLAGHQENMLKGNKVRYQYRIIHKNKSIRWVDARILPTLDKQRRLILVDGLMSDITEAVEKEQQIKQTQKLLVESQSLAKMGNWNMDIKTNTVYRSEGLQKITGAPILRGTFPEYLNTLIHPEDQEKMFATLKNVRETGNDAEITYRIIREDDKLVRTLFSVISAEKDKNGKTVRMYAMVQDITDRKKTEGKMEKLYLHMYQICHDLRSPLNSAKNYIYLAITNVTDPAALEFLAKINDSYSRMEHRVLALLDLQRINRAEATMEKIHFPDLLNDILNSFEALKGFNQVQVKHIINLKSSFYCDRQFLHSIIHNLLSNAFAHRKKEKDDEIIIAADCENDKLIIKVADNGKGIPADMQGNVFKKFQKGDSSANGTGLGLYIVKNLTAKLNGDIDFTSEENKGTTFTLKLPAKLHTEYALPGNIGVA